MEVPGAHLYLASFNKSALTSFKTAFITKSVTNSPATHTPGINFPTSCSLNHQPALDTPSTRTNPTSIMTWIRPMTTLQPYWTFSKIIPNTPKTLSGLLDNLTQASTFQTLPSELMPITEKKESPKLTYSDSWSEMESSAFRTDN